MIHTVRSFQPHADPRTLGSPNWMKFQRIISDGQTRIIGDLIISTLPYCANEQAKRILVDRGRSIRKSRGLKWLVLHHEPPPFFGPADPSEHEAKALIEEYRPDLWLSGHLHDLPYKLGGKWSHRIGTTLVFTPGQIVEAAWPNHIVLDTESGKIEWRSIRKISDRISSAVL